MSPWHHKVFALRYFKTRIFRDILNSQLSLNNTFREILIPRFDQNFIICDILVSW